MLLFGGEFTVPPAVDFISVTELFICTLTPSELVPREGIRPTTMRV